MQHSAEEILASIPALNREAIESMQEIIQDAETLAIRSKDLAESDVAAHWDGEFLLSEAAIELIFK
jgi:hypothetical protein